MLQFNTEFWKNIDLIFPEGGTYLDGVWYDNEDIQHMDIPLITTPIVKPIRHSIDTESLITWYNNGNMTRETKYSTYPASLIDNIPPLNIYAQKLYNKFLSDLDMKESSLDDFDATYSSL